MIMASIAIVSPPNSLSNMKIIGREINQPLLSNAMVIFSLKKTINHL